MAQLTNSLSQVLAQKETQGAMESVQEEST